MTSPRRLLLVPVLAFALAAPADAKRTVAASGQRAAGALSGLGQAHTYAAPAGKVYQGVATKPVSAYTNYVKKHPAVYEEFVAWGQYIPGITADATTNRSTMMMEITTAYGKKNVITPQQIALGSGDAWLIKLAGAIAASNNVTYVRLMAEMNNDFNPYSGYTSNGKSRGSAYSPSEYKQAWRRVTLIMRGGSVLSIDMHLRSLGLPTLNTTLKTLPEGKVAMQWVPLAYDEPNVAGNQASNYFPGKAYVDWVGTDLYSSNPSLTGLEKLFSEFKGYPFVFGEYAVWGNDNPTWINQLFGWVNAHTRTKMVVYNDASPEFWLASHPKSAAALRKQLANRRFLQYGPGWTAG